jgi:hypothetical protein
MYLVQSDASTTYHGLSYFVSWTERCLFTDFSIGCSIYLRSCILFLHLIFRDFAIFLDKSRSPLGQSTYNFRKVSAYLQQTTFLTVCANFSCKAHKLRKKEYKIFCFPIVKFIMGRL